MARKQMIGGHRGEYGDEYDYAGGGGGGGGGGADAIKNYITEQQNFLKNCPL